MTLDEFIALRKQLGLTQAEWAARIGMAHRGVQHVESGSSPLRDIHVLAAERAALTIAVERSDPMLAPASIRREALALVRTITGEV